LILENVLIRDKKKDTLLFAQHIKLNLSDVILLDKKFTLHHIGLQNVQVNIKKAKADSVFNYQFIIDALSGGNQTSGNNNLRLKLHKINLENISVNYNDADEEVLNTSLQQLAIDVDELNLNKKIVSVKSIYINAPQVDYVLNSVLIGAKKSIPKIDSTIIDSTKKIWNVKVESIKIENGGFNYCIKTNDTIQYLSLIHISEPTRR
jgi:hypothetical protein